MRKKTPTFGELLQAYPRIAAIERTKNERPCETTVANTLHGVRAILRGLEGDWPARAVTDLNRRRIDTFLGDARARGLAPVSAWSYLLSLRALAARWTRPYYEDLGWRVPPFDLPVCRRRAPRYRRPDPALLRRVRAWYAALADRSDPRDWIAATLMLEFAMRNGDAARLTWRDFSVRDGRVFLRYTPHKTALSSGRVVVWPVHPDIWRRLEAFRDAPPLPTPELPRRGRPRKPEARDRVVPRAGEVFARLNRELRAEGIFTGAKACYELRKICVDHVYQKFGAEMASSISGDDIETVTRYYADPSAPNVGLVRIADLL